MNHSPAELLFEDLVTQGIFSDPTDESAWPLFVSSLPIGGEQAKSLGCLYDTPGEKSGRLMTGKNLFKYGVQLRIHALTSRIGWRKAQEVETRLAAVHNVVIDISESGDSDEDTSYTIDSINQTSPIMNLGLDPEAGTHYVFTLNFLVMCRQD